MATYQKLPLRHLRLRHRQKNYIADPITGQSLESPVASEELAYGYTSKWQREKDLATGQIRMGMREYEPTVGRFTSADALKGSTVNPQTRNRYGYALNNPSRYYDLTGLYPGESVVDFSYWS